MKYIVTGGAGFIGSAVTDQLVAAGHEVVVIDNLDPAAHVGKPDYLNPDARYCFDDVRDVAVWEREANGADGIAHLAGKVGLGVNFGDASAYVDNNDVGTVTMLSSLYHQGVECRMVLASSMVVYGEGKYLCQIHGDVIPAPRDPEVMRSGNFEPPCPHCGADLTPHQIDETRPLEPRNVYAATKLHQEHLYESFAHETGVVASMLRFHNVYGPRMPAKTPYAGVASIFLSSLAEGTSPKVFEDGGQLRDFVHVRDVGASVCAALTHPEGRAGAFNVASGEPRSILDMATALSNAVNPELQPEVVGGWRDGDVRHVMAAPQKLFDSFDFAPEVGFVEGLTELAASSLRSGRGEPQ